MNRSNKAISENVRLQREKQINLGKETREYFRYIECVPRSARKRQWKSDWHPVTPRATDTCSSRTFHSRVSSWRRQLHLWGNLTSLQYDLVVRKPHVYPPCLLGIDTSLLSLPVEINVPPVYANSEISALYKSGELISKSIASSTESQTLCQKILFNDTKKIEISGPVAFIPKGFRGMQRWPDCHFIAELDLASAIASNRDKLSKVSELLGEETRILGVPWTSYDISGNQAHGIKGKEETREILQKYGSLTNYQIYNKVAIRNQESRESENILIQSSLMTDSIFLISKFKRF